MLVVGKMEHHQIFLRQVLVSCMKLLEIVLQCICCFHHFRMNKNLSMLKLVEIMFQSFGNLIKSLSCHSRCAITCVACKITDCNYGLKLFVTKNSFKEKIRINNGPRIDLSWAPDKLFCKGLQVELNITLSFLLLK